MEEDRLVDRVISTDLIRNIEELFFLKLRVVKVQLYVPFLHFYQERLKEVHDVLFERIVLLVVSKLKTDCFCMVLLYVDLVVLNL